MATQTHPLTLPAPEEYKRVGDRLRACYSEVERLEHRVRKFVDDWPSWNAAEKRPTLADIGALWTFFDDIRREGDQLQRLAEKADEVLGTMDDARINLPRPTPPKRQLARKEVDDA